MRRRGAFILARYSTDNQNPDSIEVQVEKCTEWCNENRIPILGVFADMAVSGMKETRPQYDLMMQQLRAEMADTVVIYDQSRMFRRMTAWFSFRDELEKMGVRVVSVTQPLIGKDLRDPTNFVTEGSMALFNQMHVLITRQKVIEKMRFMARSGQYTGGTPALGYCIVDGKLAICEPEAKIVRRVFSEYASGVTYRDIISGLNRDGLTSRNGKTFGVNSLHDMLKNKKYIGVLVYGRTQRNGDGSRNSHGKNPDDIIEIPDAVPAIVDMDIWEKVQAKLKANKRNKAGRPNTVRNYPLKGKVYCGECGAAMVHTGSKYSDARYHYYACSGKQRKGTCELMPIRMDTLEEKVVSAIRQILGQPKNINALITIMRNERMKLHSGCAEKLQKLIARKQEVEKKLERAADAILNGVNSKMLLKKINELEAEEANIEWNISALKKEVNACSIPDDRLENLVNQVMQDTESILSIVARVEVSHNSITIWTIFDSDPDGNIDYSDHLVEAESISTDFIEIDGDGLPAFKKERLSPLLFECPGLEPIIMQMPGGHLPAAGLTAAAPYIFALRKWQSSPVALSVFRSPYGASWAPPPCGVQ